MNFEALACRAAELFATPGAIAGVIVASAAWVVFGLPIEALTLVLSVLAITMTQLVLAAQARTERQLKRANAEVIRATPDADDAVADELESAAKGEPR